MAKLKRSLGKYQIILYGLGTIVGAGIYALAGKIVGQAGMLAPLSLFLSFAIAALTAYSYGELVKIVPKCAGEAEYVYLGFKKRSLMIVTGWAVVFTGIVSCATLFKGFAGYFQVFVDIPSYYIEALIALALTALAIKGINESIWVSIAITLIEVGGILLVSLKGLPDLVQKNFLLGEMKLAQLPHLWPGVLGATFLAFYAYIGFEDMVNLAEEVKEPKKNLPNAIFAALIISALLYLLVLLTSMATLPPERLANSKSPLADVYAANGGRPEVLGLIGMFAIINGALAQILMASRVLYGLNHKAWPFNKFNRLNPKTQTPDISTLFVGALAIGFALTLPIENLAKATSLVILIVFSLVNLSLFLILQRERKRFSGKVVSLLAFVSILILLGLNLIA